MTMKETGRREIEEVIFTKENGNRIVIIKYTCGSKKYIRNDIPEQIKDTHPDEAYVYRKFLDQYKDELVV